MILSCLNTVTQQLRSLAASESGGVAYQTIPDVVPEELCLPTIYLLRAWPVPVQLRPHSVQVNVEGAYDVQIIKAKRAIASEALVAQNG